MRKYKKVYPGGLKFINTGVGIRLDYSKEVLKKRSPDIWALKYLLDKSFYDYNHENTVTLSEVDTTMALRLHFLPRVFSKIKFNAKDDFESKAVQIISHISNRYITYDCDFEERGTKNYPESLLETNIWKDLKDCFDGEFVESKYGARQFPANIFDNIISEETRISRKLWIDIMTVNKLNQLSVIELKAKGNASLDLLAQAIDYGIFCHLFKDHISSCWFKNANKIGNNKIAIYCIAEKFHPALIDDGGIKSLIKANDLLDVIFIQIEVKGNEVIDYQILFDTRKLCN